MRGIGPEQNRVTIRNRFRYQVSGDVTRCAGLVVDNDRLPETIAHRLGHDARGHIGNAAGWKSNHHPDRPVGPR